MNLRRLRYFVAIVDAGTAAGAAEKLHVASTALSMQLELLKKSWAVRSLTDLGDRWN